MKTTHIFYAPLWPNSPVSEQTGAALNTFWGGVTAAEIMMSSYLETNID